MRAFEREFVKFRARYPWVDEYLTWNEANHCSQPTCRNPERAAQFYLALRKHCRGCRIVGRRACSTARTWSRGPRRFQKAVGNRAR